MLANPTDVTNQLNCGESERSVLVRYSFRFSSKSLLFSIHSFQPKYLCIRYNIMITVESTQKIRKISKSNIVVHTWLFFSIRKSF